MSPLIPSQSETRSSVNITTPASRIRTCRFTADRTFAVHAPRQGSPDGLVAWVGAELALPYVVKSISLSNSEQKEASYLAINPNGRIPAMVDPNKSDLAIFESG